MPLAGGVIMDHEDEVYQRYREKFLAVMLPLLFVGGGIGFLMVITGGLFLYLLLTVAGIAGLVTINYFFWGRLMSEETADERAEAQHQADAELNEWDLPEPQRPRHF
jgi:hypothetical protein